jgi:hypothetical protein
VGAPWPTEDEGDEMYPERPLTNFLSWLIEEPERLETYRTAEGFQRFVQEQGLSEELQTILRNNDLRRAMEVLRQETGSDGVLFFVVIPFVV